MKKIFLVLVAFMMATSMQVMAEDIDGDYNRINFSYGLSGVDSGSGGQTHNDIATDDWGGLMYGFKVGYIHGFKLAESKNFYLETGAQVGLMQGDFEMKGSNNYSCKNTLVSATVPLNFGYKFQFSHCFVEPFIGANARVNLCANEKLNGTTLNMFKEDDAYFGTFNRFQFGGQIGVYVGFKHVTLNVEYERESRLASFTKNLMEPAKKYTLVPGTLMFGVSYAF